MSSVNTTREDLTIEGMSCRHCVDAVAGALGQLEHVTVEEIGIGHARISYPTRAITRDEIERAVEEAGYTVRSVEEVG